MNPDETLEARLSRGRVPVHVTAVRHVATRHDSSRHASLACATVLFRALRPCARLYRQDSVMFMQAACIYAYVRAAYVPRVTRCLFPSGSERHKCNFNGFRRNTAKSRCNSDVTKMRADFSSSTRLMWRSHSARLPLF